MRSNGCSLEWTVFSMDFFGEKVTVNCIFDLGDFIAGLEVKQTNPKYRILNFHRFFER